MRIPFMIFAGAVTVLAQLVTPALAKNSDGPKADDQQAASPSSCRAYQKAADGSWQELPCQEMGAPAETRGKSATGNSDRRTR